MKTRYRALFHIVHVGPHANDGVWARIPAWSDAVAVKIGWDQIDPQMQPYMTEGLRLHGTVVLGAETWQELDPLIPLEAVELDALTLALKKPMVIEKIRLLEDLRRKLYADSKGTDPQSPEGIAVSCVVGSLSAIRMNHLLALETIAPGTYPLTGHDVIPI